MITSSILVVAVSCGGPRPASTPPQTPELRTQQEAKPKLERQPATAIEFEKPPQLISMDPADYPKKARQQGIEGTVLVRALVGTDGAVKDMIVIQSVHELVDNAALDAVRTSYWKPALQNGDPVSLWMVVPIEFSLH